MNKVIRIPEELQELMKEEQEFIYKRIGIKLGDKDVLKSIVNNYRNMKAEIKS